MRLSFGPDDSPIETDVNCFGRSELEGWTYDAFCDRAGPLTILAGGCLVKEKQAPAMLQVCLSSFGKKVNFIIWVSQMTGLLYAENREKKEALRAILEIN